MKDKSALLLLGFTLLAGCTSHPAAVSPPQGQTHTEQNRGVQVKVQEQKVVPVTEVSPAFAARIRTIATEGRLDGMERPNFSDYRQHLLQSYEDVKFVPLWLGPNGVTEQAAEVISALTASEQKGLSPSDYDASKWSERRQTIGTANDEQKAEFDAALTVATMRYISDLHIGRVNPKHFKFGIDTAVKRYDLPQFLTQQVIHAADVQAVLAEVEPPYSGYKRTEDALKHYLELAKKGDGPLVPKVSKSVGVGDHYEGIGPLVARLRLMGDFGPGSDIEDYDARVSDAVKRFQLRHGLNADGKLGAATVRELNTPIADRVEQLSLALERWRWMPQDFPQPSVVVNIPEFRLRAFEAGHKVALTMKVVVGKAAPTQTPVFTDNIRLIVMRPYWNVPLSIVRSSVIPGIRKGGKGYLEKQRMEVSGGDGDLIAGLRSGRYTVRQKPGPRNSLGLIKFLFPNSYNVYLHDTPSTELFSQSRRDFSHGCIRLEKPAELAAFLLRNQDEGRWTVDEVRKAMESGADNRTVTLQTPVPVLILYATAVVEEDGTVFLLDDIYGHDRRLKAVLDKGPPYP